MTGRSLHDALLRVLTSGPLRAQAMGGDVAAVAAEVGPAEAAALCAADPARLAALARFMGRHFYRERIVRLFAACRRLAREAGCEPLDVLATPAFAAVLNGARLGSAESADRVAGLVEATVRDVLAGRPWGAALLAYEGALFRAEAGPRRWGLPPGGEAAVRAPGARVLTLDWDVTVLVQAVRRGARELPTPVPGAVRLIVALGPDGRVAVARCTDALERVIAALGTPRPVPALAAALGVDPGALGTALARLSEIGVVEWCPVPEPDRPDGLAASA